jgi:hypothetical protein
MRDDKRIDEDTEAFIEERADLWKHGLARCRCKTRKATKARKIEKRRFKAEMANFKPEFWLIKKS